MSRALGDSRDTLQGLRSPTLWITTDPHPSSSSWGLAESYGFHHAVVAWLPGCAVTGHRWQLQAQSFVNRQLGARMLLQCPVSCDAPNPHPPPSECLICAPDVEPPPALLLSAKPLLPSADQDPTHRTSLSAVFAREAFVSFTSRYGGRDSVVFVWCPGAWRHEMNNRSPACFGPFRALLSPARRLHPFPGPPSLSSLSVA
ncbi:hypothetical protein F4780DRAFT_755980 [Xylariomycetidae sp. FL0641]|nr:hypothetical protein F4780DRAFT_755980 [Xylariomycetidae sp. FL0641]